MNAYQKEVYKMKKMQEMGRQILLLHTGYMKICRR